MRVHQDLGAIAAIHMGQGRNSSVSYLKAMEANKYIHSDSTLILTSTTFIPGTNTYIVLSNNQGLLPSHHQICEKLTRRRIH